MKSKCDQRGFSLVTAIFLLVVLAGLGAAMVTFSTSQSQSLALDVMGSRAYQAANAGVEWAAYNIASNSVANPAASGVANFGPTFGNALGGNLDVFDVSVVYTAASQVDDTTYPPDGVTETVWSYNITASAVWGTPGTADYVERLINAKM